MCFFVLVALYSLLLIFSAVRVRSKSYTYFFVFHGRNRTENRNPL